LRPRARAEESRGVSHRLIRLPHRHGLQIGDRPPDANPDELSVAVTAFEHLIGSPGRHYFGVGTMFAGQQIGGSPYIAIWDHSGFGPLISSPR
jgi:hypothetical protein